MSAGKLLSNKPWTMDAELLLWLLVVAGLVAALFWRRLPLARRRAQPPPPRLYWYMRPGGPPEGPADLTRLRAMVADGRLEPDALIAAPGSDDWRPMGSMLDAG